MSKKRVHEIGRQLKDHGVELSNPELVDKLHSLGYDVKSHSSSLEEDQAEAAFEKILAEKKPKPVHAKHAGPGFVVRKRAHTDPGHAPAEPLAPAYSHTPAAVEAQAADLADAPLETESAESQMSSTDASEPSAQFQEGQEEQEGSRPEATVGESESTPRREHAPTGKPSTGEPTMPMAAAPSGESKPAIDVRTIRPTSTQAVVISRPRVPIRRVTPPSGSRPGLPVAPGPRALGEVKEFKVVPGMLGREREFIDVSKDKKRGGRSPGRPVTEGDKGLSGKELLQAVISDRAYIPIRGKKKKATKKGAKTQITERAGHKKIIRIEEAISLSDLSQLMGVKASDLIRKLMQAGTMATINQLISADTAALLVSDFGFTVEKKGFEVEEYIPEQLRDDSKLVLRPPVVTVMGHVDHGKTSLLDVIRQSDVAAGEAGGITQHIGAYSVTTPKGPITFLDTPGHEAFTAMRARGAKVTDLVVLVVAVDDGVMPQTVEAIQHAKKSNVTILVAINKIDKSGSNPERIMQQLTEHGLVAEQWGGDTIMVPVSARTKQGVPELLEYITLQSDVLELKSDPDRLASGTVIEAKVEKGRGPVATVLVQNGTLRVGDAVVTGSHYGKVRAMMNERGEQVKQVSPGFPVEVLGLSGVPTAGDEFNVVEDEKAAKEVAEHRAAKARQKDLGSMKKATIEDLFAKAKQGTQKELNIVVKADVQGSAEAVSEALKKLAGKKVGVRVLDSGVGAITESDVLTAVAGNAIIVGFNTKPESRVEQVASQQGAKIRLFSIIYEAVDEIRKEMEGLLEPIIREKPLGKAEVRQLFSIPKAGVIAGSAVTEGVVRRGAFVRVLRDRKAIHTGRIASLRRVKDDVKEVQAGLECGIGIEGFDAMQPGDVIDAYELEEIRQSLE